MTHQDDRFLFNANFSSKYFTAVVGNFKKLLSEIIVMIYV